MCTPSKTHIYTQGRIRAALTHVRSVLADDAAADTTLSALRRAAGLLEAEEEPHAPKHEQEKGREEKDQFLSLWLSLSAEPWAPPKGKAVAAAAAAAGGRMETVPWLYSPPSGDSVEWAAMTNATYLAKTVKLHRPSPNGRWVLVLDRCGIGWVGLGLVGLDHDHA